MGSVEWLYFIALALVGAYFLAIWRLYRNFPSVRVRLLDQMLTLDPLDEARGFERRDTQAGSLLLPKAWRRADLQQEGETSVVRSLLSLREGRKAATVQMSVRPRHTQRWLWSRNDAARLLDAALTSRFSYVSLVMRSMLVRGQTGVAFSRIVLGDMQGFMRKGFQHFKGNSHGEGTGARVHQFDLFDESTHYRVDFMSFHNALDDAQVRTSLASFLPADGNKPR
jgi:hypothetical protein